MAGDPNLEITEEILLKLQHNGADLIELGIPYSDPLADGPTIQASAHRAIKAGTNTKKVLDMLGKIQDKLTTPIIIFTYANPLINRGIERSFQEIASVGASGLVIPDFPLEEAETFSPLASRLGIDLILLSAPTTPTDRLTRICNTSKGFTYLVSVTGVTGVRSSFDNRVRRLVQQLKNTSPSPVAVGFGISSPDQISQVKEWGADGAIVGSALVRRICDSSPGEEAEQALTFCKELIQATY